MIPLVQMMDFIINSTTRNEEMFALAIQNILFLAYTH